jgi:DNA-binding response OmpR family regulator
MPARLLIIDPDPDLRSRYREVFPADDFLLRFESQGERGLECAFDWKPACVLLEARLPGIPGLEVCRLLKADPRTAQTPVFFVSASASQADIVSGLKSGADEYLAKPFHPTELLWRTRGLLRRFQNASVNPEPVLKRGPLSLDTEQGICRLKDRVLRLTPKEVALLEAFLRRPGRVLKRRYLLESVWGFDEDVRTRVVDLTLFRLRRKLGPLGSRLETLPGFGYRLNLP